MEDKKIIQNLKKQYDNIKVNEKGINTMKKSIEKAKKENKKNNLIKGWSIGIAAALAIFIITPNISPTVAMAMMKVPVIGKIINVITLDKYNDKSKNINVETPKISDSENGKSEFIDNFNKTTDQYIQTLVEKFKEDYIEGENKSLDISYDIITDNSNLFSLRISGLETNASGYMFSKIYHIDKNTGNMFTLKDIFKEDSNYINILSENIKSQMRKQMKNDKNKVYFIDNKDMQEDGFKEISKEQNFYFDSNNDLVLVFDEYEVAPGYMGIVNFTIPRSEIKSIIK